MKLYILTRQSGIDWDKAKEMIVWANNKKEARQLASERAKNEGKVVWLDRDKTKIERVVLDRPTVVSISVLYG